MIAGTFGRGERSSIRPKPRPSNSRAHPRAATPSPFTLMLICGCIRDQGTKAGGTGSSQIIDENYNMSRLSVYKGVAPKRSAAYVLDCDVLGPGGRRSVADRAWGSALPRRA